MSAHRKTPRFQFCSSCGNKMFESAEKQDGVCEDCVSTAYAKSIEPR